MIFAATKDGVHDLDTGDVALAGLGINQSRCATSCDPLNCCHLAREPSAEPLVARQRPM